MSEKIDLAVKLFHEKKFKECIDAFSSVLETEPDNADVYNNMAVAYGNFNSSCTSLHIRSRDYRINNRICSVSGYRQISHSTI